MNKTELRKLYNHPVWSSPKAVIACKNLNLSYIPKKDSIGRNKKLTHLEALILLSKKAKKTLDDFLKLDSTESFKSLNCCYYTFNNEEKYYNPVYRIPKVNNYI
jgi:hypothetical protein